ncbi:RHS repeat domain-containing protein [Pseudomonas sp. NPDC087612]|uniref:RHS repeat domain-containing protein n=1 Tax=Pseudomonas sp. NPDC087612 TaxID=3364441 RepID=UPI00382CE4F6
MAFDPASSRAKYQHRREAGPAWNQNEQRKLDQQYGCGNTLYGWDGDTLAFENRTHDLGARLTHYVYEPGTFMPVAQTVEHRSIKLLLEPVYDFPYDIERDPVWQHKPAPAPFDAFAWYQCDHLGTPMELTDEQGEVAWSGTYKAWGAAQEKRSDTAKRAGIHNPLRFQGQYFDVETGLHYNRYRYYDPGVGRFVGKDPIGFAGGLNVFAYAPNPVEWVDPLGLAKKNCRCEEDNHYWGPEKPRAHNAAPNSIYTKTDRTGSVAVQNTVYDEKGSAIGQIDFKNHGGKATSGHGHIISRPGNLSAGHGPGAVHIEPNKVPKGWNKIPNGMLPAIPIGK